MKDTILNAALIAFAIAPILWSAAGDLVHPAPSVAATQARVYTMEKTVVAAKRQSSDVLVVASAAQ